MSLLKGKLQSPEEEKPTHLAMSDTPYQELMRVMVDPDGNLMLEIDGQRYNAIGQVKDRAIGQRILEVAGAMLNFTRGLIATPSGNKKFPVPDVAITAAPKPAVPAEETLASNDIDEEARERFLHQMEMESAALRQSDNRGGYSQRWDVPLVVEEKPAKGQKPKEISLLNLAEAIDEILQAKLVAVGETAFVKIHSAPDGGIRIQVNDRYYQSVDEVQEPRIKGLIEESVEEWNR